MAGWPTNDPPGKWPTKNMLKNTLSRENRVDGWVTLLKKDYPQFSIETFLSLSEKDE